MSTPKLGTAVDHRIERAQRRMQTALPGKVVSYSASAGTVTVEPQFVETWVTRDGVRDSEGAPDGANIENVPVCFPHYMSWTIDAGTFGLIVCTKYSLDQWRQQLRRMDPGDLRRFTMSGATFHPVVIGENPSVAQDFVALKADVEDIKKYLDEIKQDFNEHVHMYTVAPAAPTATTTAVLATPPKQITSTYTVQCSSRVKAEV